MLRGISVSPGIAVSQAYVLKDNCDVSRKDILPEEIQKELERLDRAIDESRRQLNDIYAEAKLALSEDESEIFAFHLAMLDDVSLLDGIRSRISAQLMAAETAVERAVEEVAQLFESIEDDYLKARKDDLKEVGSGLIKNLIVQVCPGDDKPKCPENAILVSRDIKAGDLFLLNRKTIAGIAVENGNETSHAAIISKSLGIPLVIGIIGLMDSVRDGHLVVLDACSGIVVNEPSPEEIEKYRKLKLEYEQRTEKLRCLVGLPCMTTDGCEATLMGNAGTLDEVRLVSENGGTGVGLFRTEMLFMERDSIPSEDEQFEIYKNALELLGGGCLTIRTLDAGGDKEVPHLGLEKEDNPFLGLRGIRFCLARKDLLYSQLKAILRASCYGDIRVMFPMISAIHELREAKSDMTEIVRELQASGIPCNPQLKIGVMIETPAAALISDILFNEVDFVSIGTNDLSQYVTAADRTNPKVRQLCTPFHPAVIRLISLVIREGLKNGKEVGMCGEMASSLEAVPLLLGLGLKEFSVSPSFLLPVKERILSLSAKECAAVAQKVLELESDGDVYTYLKEYTP